MSAQSVEAAASFFDPNLLPGGQEALHPFEQRLVYVHEIPVIEHPKNPEPCTVARVLENTALEINRKIIQLDDHELIALNSLLLRRNTWSNMDEIKQTRETFSSAEVSLHGLIYTLEQNGLDILETSIEGGEIRYKLSDKLLLADLRKNIPKVPLEELGEGMQKDEDSDTNTEIDKQKNLRLELSRKLIRDYENPQVTAEYLARKDKQPGERTLLSDNIGAYLQEAARYELLTKEDEQLYGGILQNGLDILEAAHTSGVPVAPEAVEALEHAAAARQLMLVTNLRLVASIAKRYYMNRRSLDYADLMHEGNVGLARAVSGFDPEKGFKFSTYAIWWIRQSITKALFDQDREIRLPAHAEEDLARINKISRELESEFGRQPTPRELASKSGIKEHTVLHLQRIARMAISLDEEFGDDNGATLKDVIANKNAAYQPEEQAVESNMLKAILDAANLNDDRAFVIGLRYGIQPEAFGDLQWRGHFSYSEVATGHPMTLDDIGKILGLTRERIRQLEKQAIELTKRNLKEKNLGAPDFL